MPTQNERNEIYRARKELEEEGIVSWMSIYDRFSSIPRNQVRRIFHRERQRIEGPEREPLHTPTIAVSGVMPDDDDIDEEAVWEQAKHLSRRKRAKKKNGKHQRIDISHGPACYVWMADLHLGDSGVDYDRLDADIDIILDTPGMYACLVGDMLNNFIVGKLKDIRFRSDFSITNEWVLVKRVLRRLAPKLLLSVSGNHDLWTFALTTVDYLREIHKAMNPSILYAQYDSIITLAVGEHEHIVRARHKWRGSSIYNDTHGIERAAKFDKGRHFDIGVGAHTHVSGLYRQFNNGGKTGHAVICGSYKVYDDFADMVGFPEANEAAGVATIVDGDSGKILGTNSLEAAAAYMNAMY